MGTDSSAGDHLNFSGIISVGLVGLELPSQFVNKRPSPVVCGVAAVSLVNYWSVCAAAARWLAVSMPTSSF